MTDPRMSDEDLDLMASAYVDGEATPDEVALVERDPVLQARVAEFRALQVPTGDVPAPPPGLANQHLAAAMAEFDALAGSGTRPGAPAVAAVGAGADETSDPGTIAAGTEATTGDDGRGRVVDLRDHTGRRATAGSGPSDRTERGRPRGIPSWLPAAAAVVVIGGGLIWAIGQSDPGSSSDDSEAASDAPAAEESPEGDEAVAMDAAAIEESEAASEMSDSADSESVEDSADSEPVGGGTDQGSTDDGSTGSPATTQAPSGDDRMAASNDNAGETEGGFDFRLDPVLVLDDVPDPYDIVWPGEPFELARSVCGPELVDAGLGQPVGFLPLEIAGEPAELFLFTQGDGSEFRLLVDQHCGELGP